MSEADFERLMDNPDTFVDETLAEFMAGPDAFIEKVVADSGSTMEEWEAFLDDLWDFIESGGELDE